LRDRGAGPSVPPARVRVIGGVGGRRRQPAPPQAGFYLSCTTAILSALSSAYHGSPLGATVTPNGSLPFTLFPSVTTRVDVIRAMFPARDWANQTDPSGAAAMPSGPPPGASGGGRRPGPASAPGRPGP